jgi:hypothetical protein
VTRRALATEATDEREARLLERIDRGGPRPGRYIVVTRDRGINVKRKMWLHTRNLPDEVRSLKRAGVRILHVATVEAYFGRRVAAAAALLLLIGAGVLVVIGNPFGSPPPSAAPREPAAAGIDPIDPQEQRQAAIAAQVRQMQRDEAAGGDPSAADSAKGAATSSRVEDESRPASERTRDIFDLLSPGAR